jgi:transcription elongation GreA/GreB family factor
MIALEKTAVLKVLLAAVQEQCAAVERVAAMARDEASSDETRSEGKYDTRATEASFLARGQAERVDDLRRARSWLEQEVHAANGGAEPAASTQVEIGALVEVQMRGRTELLYIAPMTTASVRVGERTVRVVAQSSPLGTALANACSGDVLEIDGPQGTVECEVIDVV